MLKYFYTSKYGEPIQESQDLHVQLQIQLLTYNLADKYDVPTLMRLAVTRFKATLDEGPSTTELLSLIADVYTIPMSTNTLRVIALEYARRVFRDMMQGPDLEILRTSLKDTKQCEDSVSRV